MKSKVFQKVVKKTEELELQKQTLKVKVMRANYLRELKILIQMRKDKKI